VLSQKQCIRTIPQIQRDSVFLVARSLCLCGIFVFVAFPSFVCAQNKGPVRISFGERPMDFDNVQAPPDTPAKMKEALELRYPDSALQHGIEGMCFLALAIDSRGIVTYAEVRKSSGNTSLDSAALSAAKDGNFIPAKRNGLPVASYVTLPVEFTFAQSDMSVNTGKNSSELLQEKRELERAITMLEEEPQKIEEELARLPPQQNSHAK